MLAVRLLECSFDVTFIQILNMETSFDFLTTHLKSVDADGRRTTINKNKQLPEKSRRSTHKPDVLAISF